ncbi:hypothetical protein [Oceanibium sediminis]|uniref:hypothetical protein n=1 Tax=Oceanibium sediminis TaxID=2026339 RepID=UPI000DD4CA48|nr:hypothetical protein [Oceanibium sediminis]
MFDKLKIAVGTLMSADSDEDGAVTVDWVVLTASIIVIGLIVWNIVQGGIVQGASDIRAGILSASNL